MCDAGREGRAHGAPLGRIVDPFGEPVKRAFALFPAAAENGRGMEFVSAYLSAAWFDGIDITTESGLQQVIANADLDWEMLHNASQNNDWEAILDDNLRTLVEENLWGVPSFRVSGGKIDTAYACWGQDRIWRVENEIARRA
jgi:2-hydroxychromene-2-carboxylate isomerase